MSIDWANTYSRHRDELVNMLHAKKEQIRQEILEIEAGKQNDVTRCKISSREYAMDKIDNIIWEISR